MKQIFADYRNFRMLADQPRWRPIQNAIRLGLGIGLTLILKEVASVGGLF
jgi:hypothetical protein